MVSDQVTVRASISKQLKAETDKIFDDLGLTASEAIRIFLRQVRLRNGLPFQVTLDGLPIPAEKMNEPSGPVDGTHDAWDMLLDMVNSAPSGKFADASENHDQYLYRKDLR